MKKPLLTVTVTFFFLSTTAVCLVGLGQSPPFPLPQDASGLPFVETRDSDGQLSLNSPQVAGSNIADTTPVKKVELLVLDAGPGGSGPIKMGFLVELEPDWHIYWANPGDAGLAPSVRWTLPAGFKAGPLLHPVPRRSVAEDIVAFEHKGPVLLLCDITPPSARPPGTWEAAAVLEWMACRESCIAGETAVRTVYPPDAAALEKGRSLLATFAPRFPHPLAEAGLSAGAAQATLAGAEWRVEIVLTGPRAAEADDFFPYPLDDFVIAHSRISCRDGRIIVPLTPSRGPGAPPPQAVRGLVIIDGAGYEAAVPLASGPDFAPISTHSILSWR